MLCCYGVFSKYQQEIRLMIQNPNATDISVRTSDLQDVLGGVLDAAIGLAEADFGNIQLLDPDGLLRIVVQRGFPDWWVEYWNDVTTGKGACGTSLALGERVIVEDVEAERDFHRNIGLRDPAKGGSSRGAIDTFTRPVRASAGNAFYPLPDSAAPPGRRR